MFVLGADPGLKGAFGFFSLDAKEPSFVIDMPVIDLGHKNRDVDFWKVGEILAKWAPALACAYVEHVHAMPARRLDTHGAVPRIITQGISSTCNFCRGHGYVLGVLSGLRILPREVSPQRWKPAVGLSSGASKDESRQLAEFVYPHLADQLKRAKDDGRAEALLIAWYGAKASGHVPRV